MRDDDGDPVADMAALYERTWPRLIGVLVSIGGSRTEAEEIAQDAYVKLLGRWANISRYDDPEAWVRAMAVRTLLSRLRRHAPNRAMATLAGSLSTDRESSVDASDVAAALALITPEQRAVVVLHHVLELPVEQIAEELQLAQGTVRSRLTRAQKVLAPVLEVTGNA